VPVEWLPAKGAESAAIQSVIERLVSAAGQPAPRPVSSAFEGTPFYGLLTRLEADLLEFKLEPDDLRAEFDGALRNLEGERKSLEIKGMLAREEKTGLPERLREGAALRQRGDPAPLPAGAETPSKGL
jgi:hypothetical protein